MQVGCAGDAGHRLPNAVGAIKTADRVNRLAGGNPFKDDPQCRRRYRRGGIDRVINARRSGKNVAQIRLDLGRQGCDRETDIRAGVGGQYAGSAGIADDRHRASAGQRLMSEQGRRGGQILQTAGGDDARLGEERLASRRRRGGRGRMRAAARWPASSDRRRR
jgi:hypothetical protein